MLLLLLLLLLLLWWWFSEVLIWSFIIVCLHMFSMYILDWFRVNWLVLKTSFCIGFCKMPQARVVSAGIRMRQSSVAHVGFSIGMTSAVRGDLV